MADGRTVAVVTYHVPDPDGTAAGQALWALAEGLIGHGHQVRALTFWPTEPARLPSWCAWQPLPVANPLVVKARAVLQPRTDSRRLAAAVGALSEGADVRVADEPITAAAFGRRGPDVLVVHYSDLLDAQALGDRSPRALQSIRGERRLRRRATTIDASSTRVARVFGARARYAPIAYAPPAEAVPPVDAPVVTCVAGWDWPPNAWALQRLLAAWPLVRAAVPTAELRLAGRGSEGLTGTGVVGLGRVERTDELLAETAVVAFPCPTTSGPKVKVLEAMALGLPLVTTGPGLEGVEGAGAGAIVREPEPAAFAAGIVALLLDPGRRAALGTAGRAAILAHHAPAVVAGHRMAAWETALGRA